ncbi:MAG: hypothetical protein PVF45_10040 [Anaerolineae bacterium]
MNKKITFTLILLAAALVLCGGCGSKESATATTGVTEAPEPTSALKATAEEVTVEQPTAVAEATVEEPTAAAPMEEPTPAEPTPEPPSPTMTMTPTPEIVDEDSSCINCHTDEERLKELAVEPEVEELSSGEG